MNANIYIVDDDQHARESLAWLIESINLPVCAFVSGHDFLDNTDSNVRGCLVLDVRMPDINGMDLFHQIQQKNYRIPVIIMTGHADVALAVRAMKAGVYDFIEKPYNDALMLERIQAAIAFDENNQKERDQIQTITQRLASLTPRETQILNEVLHSVPNKIIADKLSISIKTVELHRSNLMSKMHVNSATELVRQVMICHYPKASEHKI